jgi:UTP--glucose-1-phosphate uridylyltransferase
MSQNPNQFAQLLGRARSAVGVSRASLARQIGVNASYIHRLEAANRRPSRETVLALADALAIEGERRDQWLVAAGFSPMPLTGMVRGAIRARGGLHHHMSTVESPRHSAAIHWGTWLESLGIKEDVIARLLRALEDAQPTMQRQATRMVSGALSVVTEHLESLVQTAVVPAAKENHVIAVPAIQRMLLRVINEAANAGITNIILVLAPGMVDPIYIPLKEALDIMVVPRVQLQYCLQTQPKGLGDAVLRAEGLVGREPFAVLLPDDIVLERANRECLGDLRRMIEVLALNPKSNLVAVASVPKSKMSQYGVAVVNEQERTHAGAPIIQLVEKPDETDSVIHSKHSKAIVGRYLFQPAIFEALNELKENGEDPLQLTVALDLLREAAHEIYAIELKSARRDIGEVLGRANELIEVFSEERIS